MSITKALTSSPVVNDYFGDLFSDAGRLFLLVYHCFALFAGGDAETDTDNLYANITNRLDKLVGK